MQKLQDPIPIYTIGYGSRSIEQFIEALQQHDIAYLIDVRSTPYSRYKPEFSKEALAAELQRHRIRYVFMGDTLGGHPDDEIVMMRMDRWTTKRWRLPKFTRGELNVSKMPLISNNALLSCVARESLSSGHRSKLIGASLDEQDISVIHIDENDEEQTQEKVIDRLTGGQMRLFGEDTFHSRKQYR